MNYFVASKKVERIIINPKGRKGLVEKKND